MKYFTSVLFIWFLMIGLFLNGQTAEEIKRIDSLETALSKETNLESRLAIMVRLMQGNKFRNEERATYFAQKVLDESQDLEPNGMTIEAKMYFARKYQSTSKMDSSILILNEVLEDNKYLNLLDVEWRVYMLMGNAYDNMGDLEKAYDYFMKGFNCQEKTDDEDEKTQIRIIFANNLGNNLRYRNKVEEALEYYNLALNSVKIAIDKSLNSSSYINMQGVIFNSLGAVYSELGDDENAIEYLFKSIELRESIGNQRGALYATVNLFNHYLDNRNFDAVLEMSSKVLNTADEIEDPFMIITLNSLVIDAELNVGELSRAKAKLDKIKPLVNSKDIPLEALYEYKIILFDYYLSNDQMIEAKNLIKELEKIVIQTGKIEKEKALHFAKIRFYSKSGDQTLLEESLNNFSLHFENILDQNLEVLAKVEADFTNLENEQKVVLLQKDNDVLTAISSRNKLAAIAAILVALLSLFFFWRNKKQKSLIENQKDRLHALNQTKDQIFSIIGHDLKKPAIAFRGITQKLKYLINSGDEKRLLKFGESVEKDALQLNTLTDNLLSWALLQKDLITFKEEKINLANVSEEIVGLFANIAKDKNIDLISDVGDIIVQSDKNVLMTVLRNLVDNALKYTDNNGKVTVDAKQINNKVELLVIDNGRGIAEDQIPNLFVLSKEKSTTGTAGEKGTGLGLHIVKDLVEKSKGTISVNSRIGEGTSFNILLPT